MLGSFKDKRLQEITGIVLILLAVIIFLSLVSFKLADYRLLANGGDVSNIMGPLGAGISHLLRSAVGLSSFIVAAIIALLGWTAMQTGSLVAGIEKTSSLFFFTITTACLAGFISPDVPQISGGYAGCGIAALLKQAIGSVGAFLIILILNIAGLILLRVFSMASIINKAAAAEERLAKKKGLLKLLHKKKPAAADATVDKITPPINTIASIAQAERLDTGGQNQENISQEKRRRMPWITKETVLVHKRGFGSSVLKPKLDQAIKLLEMPAPMPQTAAASNAGGSSMFFVPEQQSQIKDAVRVYKQQPIHEFKGKTWEEETSQKQPVVAKFSAEPSSQEKTDDIITAAAEPFVETECTDTFLASANGEYAGQNKDAANTDGSFFAAEDKLVQGKEPAETFAQTGDVLQNNNEPAEPQAESSVYKNRIFLEAEPNPDYREKEEPYANRIFSIDDSEEDGDADTDGVEKYTVSPTNAGDLEDADKFENTEAANTSENSENIENIREKTTAEVDDNAVDFDKEFDREKIDLARPVPMVFAPFEIKGKYSVPAELLKATQPTDAGEWKEEIQKHAAILIKTLAEFGVEATLAAVSRGPVITRYEISLAAGTPVNRVVNLADNLAMALAALSVRVVAPIPGKSTVGIEIPNKLREMVSLGDIIHSKEYKTGAGFLKVALGKDISGKPVTLDLKRQPHLLIAGATGSGKSVCVNTIISSLICNYDPNYVRFIMVDPKMVELQLYNGMPHLLTPVITEPQVTPYVLKWAIYEMERRYRLLAAAQTRDIQSYNDKTRAARDDGEILPYIVIIIDELADLMMVAAKEIEGSITRLAQKARAIGIHLVLATQRPSVDVITGTIKANFPARIAFQVAQKNDSRTIIDRNGSEKLLGQGDMLYLSPTSSFPSRIQGAFISEDEITAIVTHLEKYGEPVYIDIEQEMFNAGEALSEDGADDELFVEALKIVEETRKASASYLQRRLSIGYNRAARMIELMEERGYIGAQQGSKPREIYI